MRELLKIFKALSDESRLRVLNLLYERECCVCEVEQVLEVSQSKASRILSGLSDAGFLHFRKEGLWSLYSVDWDGMEENTKEILDAAYRSFKDYPQMKTDRERLRTTEMACPACNCSVNDIADNERMGSSTK